MATLFFPLPYRQRRPILGGCSCGYCKKRPYDVPSWDTIGIDTEDGSTWTVHYPELTWDAETKRWAKPKT